MLAYSIVPRARGEATSRAVESLMYACLKKAYDHVSLDTLAWPPRMRLCTPTRNVSHD